MEDENLSPVKSNTVEGNVKQNQGRKYGIKDDLLKCDACEYKCKKDETLRKNINTKHEDHLCSNCQLRFDNINDLQKHVAKDHSNSLKDRNETQTYKNIEQDICMIIKDDNSRCSRCGYFYSLKTSMKKRDSLKYSERSAQFWIRENTVKKKDCSNQKDCTARHLVRELVLPVPGLSSLLFVTYCAKYSIV